ncbi:MAG TPA: helix-turn-helix domain-containing protein [Candidatus Onthovivens sp.]|nr:helix-turn-helix domain-containing protein [Candidatus Onthovivens sp.]
MTIELALRLIEFRKKSGLSQDELATKLNVSRQSISKWESGESSPNIDYLISLSKIYGVTLDDLINPEKSVDECYQGEREDSKKKKKDRVDISPNGIFIDNEDEHVHISLDGIDLENLKDRVHFGEKGEDSEVIYDNITGKIIKKRPHIKNISSIINLTCLIMALVAYLAVSFTVDGGWGVYWILFICALIPAEIVECFYYKKSSKFPITYIAISTYLFLGMLQGMWHPTWIILLAIPLYYLFSNLVNSIIDVSKEKRQK